MPIIVPGAVKLVWLLSLQQQEFMEQTARVLSQLGSKEQPSKGFQSLIRQIGEAKTKHVSLARS